MSDFIDRLNRSFEILPERLHPWRWWVLGIYILLMLFLASGIPRFAFTWANEEMFGKEDPVQKSLNRIKELFGGTSVLAMIYRPVDGDLFSKRSLKALQTTHRILEEASNGVSETSDNPLSLIKETESLINTTFIDVKEDSIRFREFIGETLPEDESHSRALEKTAFNEPDYLHVLISENGEYGLLIVRTNLGELPVEEITDDSLAKLEEGFDDSSEKKEELLFFEHGLEDYAEFEKAVWKLLQEESIRKDLVFLHPGWGAFYQNDVWAVDYQRSLAIALLFSLFLTWMLLGSLRAVLWPMLILITSMTGVLGLAGWTGWPIDLSLYIAFGLISVAAIADVVHVLSGYLFFHQQGQNHAQVMRSVFSKTAMACLLTSITTAIGVFSLFFINLKVIQTMGLLAGIGVLFAFILTLFLLPVLIDWFPPKPLKSKDRSYLNRTLKVVQYLIRQLEWFNENHPKSIILFFSIASILLLLGIFRVEIDTVFSEYFPAESQVRQTINLMDEQFLGAGNMEILFESETEGVFKDPEVLLALESIKIILEDRYPNLVTHNWTLNNQIKQTHQKLNENRIEAYSIPNQPELVAQLLVLIEGGDYENLGRMVSLDYTRARMSVSLKTLGSKKSVELLNSVQPEIQKVIQPLIKKYPDFKATVTGGVGAWARVFDAISWSQIRSFGLAFLIISLILIFVFGSLKLGIIAILPNSFPMLTVFGLMGWIGYKLDTTTLMTAPIIIGIAVDDTIHFLTHYRLSLKRGESISGAINSTLREVGQAITVTTLILMSLFVCFIPVSNVGVSRFSLLALVAVFSALLADLILLPALLRVFRVRS